MKIVYKPIGNFNDKEWRGKFESWKLDPLLLDQWQAQKNRFRLRSIGGIEVAVALERNTHLRDGDILILDEETKTAVIVSIDLQDVLVIDLSLVLNENPESLAQTCFELGHALGNQHWPSVVKNTKVYVPLTVDRRVMASVLRTHAFPGITFEFHPGKEIIPYLAPHEARRLFGGADSTDRKSVV